MLFNDMIQNDVKSAQSTATLILLPWYLKVFVSLTDEIKVLSMDTKMTLSA